MVFPSLTPLCSLLEADVSFTSLTRDNYRRSMSEEASSIPSQSQDLTGPRTKRRPKKEGLLQQHHQHPHGNGGVRPPPSRVGGTCCRASASEGTLMALLLPW